MANNISLDDYPALVREFASYKSAIQNCSEKTVSEYLLDLRTFFRFLLAREKKIQLNSDEFEKIDIRTVVAESNGIFGADLLTRCRQAILAIVTDLILIGSATVTGIRNDID